MRTLVEGLRFPEGPIALADGSILLVEIERQTLSRVAADGTVSVVAEMGGGPNGAALGPDGAAYVCNNGGFVWSEVNGMLRPGNQPDDYVTGSIQRVDLTSGDVTTLYTDGPDGPLRGPNDIVFDRAGGFYFTDLGKRRNDEFDHGALYYAQPDGSSITTIARPLLTPNGVGLSPAEDRVYFAETMTGKVRYFELSGPGQLAPNANPGGGHLLGAAPGEGRFDSLAVDNEGNVCVATLGTGAITAFAPDGHIRAIVPVPGDPFVTNICFGGEDNTTAFITASGYGTLRAHEWHCPGLALNFSNS